MKIYHVPATNGENESSMRIKKSNICDGDTKELVLQFSKEYMNLYSTITNVQTVHNLCSQYNIESFLAILNKIIILQSTFLLTRIDFTSCSFKKVVRFCFVFRLIERNMQRESTERYEDTGNVIQNVSFLSYRLQVTREK